MLSFFCVHLSLYPRCYNLFSGVKLSKRLFCFISLRQNKFKDSKSHINFYNLLFHAFVRLYHTIEHLLDCITP